MRFLRVAPVYRVLSIFLHPFSGRFVLAKDAVRHTDPGKQKSTRKDHGVPLPGPSAPAGSFGWIGWVGMTASRALRVEAKGCICPRLLQRVLAGRLLFGLCQCLLT